VVKTFSNSFDDKGRRLTNGDKHVDVDLPILQCRIQILNIVLVSQRTTIFLETGLDFAAFVLRQKPGTVDENTSE